jgi:shikimate kinase
MNFQSRGRLQKLPRLFFGKIFRVIDMNIILIGYRCSGKSVVGKTLAKNLALELADTDQVLEGRIGSSIPDYVAENGWEAFRMVEKMIVRSISNQDRRVIATGGGVVLDWENVRNLRHSGWVVWLQAGVTTIQNRMMQDERSGSVRPGLVGKNPLVEIQEVLSQRTTLYERACDYVVNTDQKSPLAVSKEIIQSMPQGLTHLHHRDQSQGTVSMSVLNP